LDKESLNVFPADDRPSSNPWRLLKVADGPLGFSETGIVCALAERMSKIKISLFYVSTFFTDYLMVEEKNFAKAVTALKEDSFSISEP